jgi:transposase-like protein
MTNELSPEQRERLARLIESELGSLRDAALAAGATPESVSDTLRDRRRALEADEPAEPTAESAEPADPDDV